MADRASQLVLLGTALAIAGLVALWLAPAATQEKGVPIAGWTVCDLAFGDEVVERPFVVEHGFDRISLSYVIDEAAHIRTAFVDPTGQTTEGIARREAGKDVIDLEVQDPMPGAWSWRLWAAEGTTGSGYLDKGDFIVLGFGLDALKVERTPGTGGVMPSGRC